LAQGEGGREPSCAPAMRAALALLLASALRAPESANAGTPCMRIVALATPGPGVRAVPTTEELSAYCTAVWPERTSTCPALAAALVNAQNEASPPSHEHLLAFCQAPARAPPKPSVLWNLARVLLPVTLPAVEAAPAPTAGPGVTVTLRAGDWQQKLLAKRNAVLGAAPQPGPSAPSAPSVPSAPSAAPPARTSGGAGGTRSAGHTLASTQRAATTRAGAGTTQGLRGTRAAQRRTVVTERVEPLVPDQQPALFWRVVGFLCDYRCGYVPPQRSLEITSAPATDDDDDE